MTQRNLLDALVDLALGKHFNDVIDSDALNSKQEQGRSFEDYCKDLLAGVTDSADRERLLAEQFSYLGSPNNPPDAMFRGGNRGDAFEFKKSGSPRKENQLNSSYPTSRLVVSNPRLTAAAKNCEPWQSRDFFYFFGDRPDLTVVGNWLWIVQGNLLAEDVMTLSTLEEKIRSAIAGVIRETGYEPADTKELGRINSVDSIGSASLRIRPMWLLKGPETIFGHLSGADPEPESRFVVHALMTRDKWQDLAATSLSWQHFPMQNDYELQSVSIFGHEPHAPLYVDNPSNFKHNSPQIPVVLVRICFK